MYFLNEHEPFMNMYKYNSTYICNLNVFPVCIDKATTHSVTAVHGLREVIFAIVLYLRPLKNLNLEKRH